MNSSDARRPVFVIEREKRWRIWLLFVLLLVMVCAGVWVACLLVSLCLMLLVPVIDLAGWLFTWSGIGIMVLVALPLATVYWLLSRIGARDRLLKAMHCQPLDGRDHYHRRLANVVEEMRLATGGPSVECVVVPTLGFNAFSFSDLRGGGVIGVTEGALSRLSRQQLQGVVAHELGHILSGSCVTATASCLLFGVYTGLGERMEDAVLDGGTSVPAVAVVAVPLRLWLWVLQTASLVTDAALSREREWLADLAAARFTRDPLSLAEALLLIARHPGGAGYIPEGLTPLCIREGESRRGPLAHWRRTHPTMDERVNALLRLANVSRADFERQVDAAEQHLGRQAHWQPQPQSSRGAGDARRGPEVATSLRSSPAAGVCPVCGGPLRDVVYEGAEVRFCPSCGGSLVRGRELHRVLARREVGFTAEQYRLADEVAAAGNRLRRASRIGERDADAPSLFCPCCGKAMMRGHYNYDHALNVNRCTICDVIWFDRDGLEVLQVLTERQVE